MRASAIHDLRVLNNRQPAIAAGRRSNERTLLAVVPKYRYSNAQRASSDHTDARHGSCCPRPTYVEHSTPTGRRSGVTLTSRRGRRAGTVVRARGSSTEVPPMVTVTSRVSNFLVAMAFGALASSSWLLAAASPAAADNNGPCSISGP